MESRQRKFDILILGATGFTGKFVARDLYRFTQQKGLKWAAAGRSRSKLEDTIQWIGDVQIPIVVVDVFDTASLAAAAKSARILLNCIGPFRFSGSNVVAACIAAGTDYLDISGEPEFIERILAFSRDAVSAGVTVVPCCGFDSVPADLGNLFVKQEFSKRGFTATQVEMYINLAHGPSGITGNYATYESAVHGLANAHALRRLRKDANRTPLPIIGPKLPLYGSARFEKLFTKKWCFPFFGADATVVRISQQLVETTRRENDLDSKALLQPTQFNAYISADSIFQLFGLAFFGASMYYLTPYKWGRKLLLAYPRFFSLGLFTKQGPSDLQLKESAFISTFAAKGYKKLISQTNDVDPKNAPLEYEIVATVAGPESGYVTTPICILQCAFRILVDRNSNTGLVPHGVLTPAAAFQKTSLISELVASGISFTIQSEKNLI
ncbi:hypothetical protein HK100_006434 [Physocladia obscura]|uniref:Saccharopine dehydrogenase NADP binding domain-containing protein n=1 Tax=Physocladia obscura TaxID=109957 RepID=A0AAD5T695_9FUNG|nr:hypothetical protein HK100_006434 [Physocladia obscura]